VELRWSSALRYVFRYLAFRGLEIIAALIKTTRDHSESPINDTKRQEYPVGGLHPLVKIQKPGNERQERKKSPRRRPGPLPQHPHDHAFDIVDSFVRFFLEREFEGFLRFIQANQP